MELLSNNITGKTYIYGAGKLGEKVLRNVESLNPIVGGRIEIVGFIDKKATDGDFYFCGLPVISPAEITKIEDLTNIIVAYRYPGEMMQEIKKTGYMGAVFAIYEGKNKLEIHPIMSTGDIASPAYADLRYEDNKDYSLKFDEIVGYESERFRKSYAMIEKIPHNTDICELGCGSGQFANMLFDKGFINYTGVDYSKKGIEIAQSNNEKYKDRFICADVFGFLKEQKKPSDLYVVFEVLEHISRDIELVKSLPKNSWILFSVPNFMSFDHLRTYEKNDIKERYPMIDILNYTRQRASEVYDYKCWHIVLGRIR